MTEKKYFSMVPNPVDSGVENIVVMLTNILVKWVSRMHQQSFS